MSTAESRENRKLGALLVRADNAGMSVRLELERANAL